MNQEDWDLYYAWSKVEDTAGIIIGLGLFLWLLTLQ